MNTYCLCLLTALLSTSAFAAPDFSFFAGRTSAAGELFDIDFHNANTLLKMIENRLKKSPFTTVEESELKQMLCGASGPVRTIELANKKIEQLPDSDKQGKALKALYGRLHIASTISPYIDFCAGKKNAAEAASAARASHDAEQRFAAGFLNIIK
jgi:hypothetical protein